MPDAWMYVWCMYVGRRRETRTGVLDIVGRQHNSNSYRGVMDMYVWRLSFSPAAHGDHEKEKRKQKHEVIVRRCSREKQSKAEYLARSGAPPSPLLKIAARQAPHINTAGNSKGSRRWLHTYSQPIAAERSTWNVAPGGEGGRFRRSWITICPSRVVVSWEGGGKGRERQTASPGR